MATFEYRVRVENLNWKLYAQGFRAKVFLCEGCWHALSRKIVDEDRGAFIMHWDLNHMGEDNTSLKVEFHYKGYEDFYLFPTDCPFCGGRLGGAHEVNFWIKH